MHIHDKNLHSSTYLNSRIRPDDTILLHGGGNFGDLYRHHVHLRNFLITEFPTNKIVVFPQTINYRNRTLALTDSRVYANASDMTIMLRSSESFEFAQKTFVDVKIRQVPDVAFMIGDLTPASEPSVDILVLRRTDRENQYLIKQWKSVFDDKIGNKSRVKYLVGFYMFEILSGLSFKGNAKFCIKLPDQKNKFT